jgi:hypothetical protein
LRRGIFLLVFSVTGGVLWLLRPDAAPLPEVVLLPSDYSIQAPPLPVPDRWIPPTWGWLWRLRYTLLGKPLTVDIDTELIEFGEPRQPPIQTALAGRALTASTNGVFAWILSEDELKALARSRELEPDGKRYRTRMTLGPGVLATMSMTTSPQIEGVSFTAANTITYAVRKRGDALELTGTFASTEIVPNLPAGSQSSNGKTVSLNTNLTLAAKMQIPRGYGVFLYDTNRAATQGRSTGLLIQLKAK